ncbi:MAG: hypothetical protein ACRC6R_07320 [Bacteroidales bacterium]
MNSNRKLIFVIAALVGLLLAGAIYITMQHRTISDMSQEFDIQKEELETEYEQLAVQYEGYNNISVQNDSLIELLDNEKMKVQRLLEELKTVKSTNSRRINELKKELSTLRNVMKSYIIQIDSLNQANARLREENTQVKARYQAATQTVSSLNKEKEKLSQKVNLASQLQAVNIHAGAIDKRNKNTDRLSRATKLQFSFTLARNVTAEVGDKFIYIRIQKPDGDVLVKSSADLFKYENKEINFSARKQIEYTGDEISTTLYWNIDEFLYPGDYRVDIFADAYLIGSQSFSLRK